MLVDESHHEGRFSRYSAVILISVLSAAPTIGCDSSQRGDQEAKNAGSRMSAQVQVDDVAAIKAAFLSRQNTFNARDLAGQLRLFTDDITFNTATGRVNVSGKEDYALLLLVVWDGPMKQTQIREEVEDIAFLGEDVAVVHFRLKSILPEGTTAANYDEIRGMRVLVKRDGKWLFRVSCHIPFLKGALMTPEKFDQLKEEYRPQLKEVMGL